MTLLSSYYATQDLLNIKNDHYINKIYFIWEAFPLVKIKKKKKRQTPHPHTHPPHTHKTEF